MESRDTGVHICNLCGEPTEEPTRHHVTPRSRGGKDGEIRFCCPTCHGQIHMLFTEKELAAMSFEELRNRPEIKKYRQWKKKRPGRHGHRLSSRLRRKR